MRICKNLWLVLGVFLTFNLSALSLSTSVYDIPYADGATLHLKEKKLISCKACKVIVLVNSLSIPSLAAFDVSGYSLMDALANSGYDVWGIDFIGEGKSSYPRAMQESPAPLGVFPLSASEALPQFKQAIDYISTKTGQSSVALLGWSWGSVVAAMYSINYPRKVNHLILYGAMYSARLPESVATIFVKPFAANPGEFKTDLAAYQNIPWEIIKNHWQMMRHGNLTIARPEAVSAVGATYTQCDPHPVIPGSLRRPMGPLRDLFTIWNGKPLYEIKQLSTPTLVIYGDQDLFADRSLYGQLKKTRFKQEVQLKQATHWLIYEKTRAQFVAEVLAFLKK